MKGGLHVKRRSQGKAAMPIFYSRLLPHVDVFLVLHVGMIGVAFGEARLNEQAVLRVQSGRQNASRFDLVIHVIRDVECVGSAARQVCVSAANHRKQKAGVEVGTILVVRHVRVALNRLHCFEVGGRREHHVILEFGKIGGRSVLKAHSNL